MREPAVRPRILDKGTELVLTLWQDFLNSAPISDSILQVLLCTYHVPTSVGLPSLSHVLCPPESWQVPTNMPPFPPLSPAERLLSWVGLISWSKPDILENVCSGTEQAGIFISRLHLHCFLSWRGAGGWGEGGGDVASLCQPKRRPSTPLLSSLSSPSSSGSLGLMEAGAFRTFERSAQLEVAISNYPPISPDCKMCFCVGCLLGRIPVLWVASRCSFRRPGRGTSRCPGPPASKWKSFLWSYPGVTTYSVGGSVRSFIRSFMHAASIYRAPICRGLCQVLEAQQWARITCSLSFRSLHLGKETVLKRKENFRIEQCCTGHKLEREREQRERGCRGTMFFQLGSSQPVSPRRRHGCWNLKG